MFASSTLCFTVFKPFYVAVGRPKSGQVHGLRAGQQQQQPKSEEKKMDSCHVSHPTQPEVADRVDSGEAARLWKDQEACGSGNLVAHLALMIVVGFLLHELV